MTEFSPQLDMLIEKPRLGGKVHICADGGTMPGLGKGQCQPQAPLCGSGLCFLCISWSLWAV